MAVLTGLLMSNSGKISQKMCTFHIPNQFPCLFHCFLPNQIDGSVAELKMKLTQTP